LLSNTQALQELSVDHFATMKSLSRLTLDGILVFVLPVLCEAANVTVNVSSSVSTVATTAYGIHTSVYDNQNANAALPGQLIASGVNTLRYPGGGYADIYHWSIQKGSPWQDGSYGYLGPSTDFGSFIGLLANAHAQAVITVNFGSGVLWNAGHTTLVAPPTNAEPQEAAAWVAYANADASIYGTPNDVAIGTDSIGNNWKTAGFWAKLRSSTAAQYQTWATAGGVYDAASSFLAINHSTPVGVKYWEIGNETFGSGFYGGGDGYSVNYAVPYPYTNYVRQWNAALSPTTYGQQVRLFSLAMKAVDPTIKIGAAVSTPPGDYSWDIDNTGQRWTPQVLAQCYSNIDFVIAHWYPTSSGNGSVILTGSSGVGTTLPFMINGQTAGQDSDTNSGLRDWINAYRPSDGTNVQIFITEFGYMGSVNNSVLGPVNALFGADAYATWMEYGVSNVDYLEMNKGAFLGDANPPVRGAVYYSIQLMHNIANVGDPLIRATSDTSSLRAHAAVHGGKLGLLLLNESPTLGQTVNVTVTNAYLTASGTKIQYGTNNFVSGNIVPATPPSTNTVSGLSNLFSVTIPAYSMVEFIIPIVSNTAPDLSPISDQILGVGQTLAFTASATDTDQPPQTLTFSLLSGPTNATLNATSGDFSWRPWVTQANSSNRFTLSVTDNGTPSLSDTQSFNVTVNPVTIPTLSSFAIAGGQPTLQINGDSGPDYEVLTSTDLVNWVALFITNSPPMPFQWTDTNSAALPAQFYRIKVGPPLP
jgi:hypothetical protein